MQCLSFFTFENVPIHHLHTRIIQNGTSKSQSLNTVSFRYVSSPIDPLFPARACYVLGSEKRRRRVLLLRLCSSKPKSILQESAIYAQPIYPWMVDGISKKHGFANDVSTLLFARCIFRKLDEKHSMYCSVKIEQKCHFYSFFIFTKNFLKRKVAACKEAIGFPSNFR